MQIYRLAKEAAITKRDSKASNVAREECVAINGRYRAWSTLFFRLNSVRSRPLSVAVNLTRLIVAGRPLKN